MLSIDSETTRRLSRARRWSRSGKARLVRRRGIGPSRIIVIAHLKRTYASIQRIPGIGGLATVSVARLTKILKGRRTP